MLKFSKGHKSKIYFAYKLFLCHNASQRGIFWSIFHKIIPKFDQVIFTLVLNSLQNFKSLAQAVPEIFCLQAFPMPQCPSPQSGIVWSVFPLNCYILNILALGLMVLEKEIFLSFSHFKPRGANEPWGVANLDPRGMVGRIYVCDHLTLLHTKYLSSGPYVFKKEDF